jgi:hypothetical protein
MAGALALMAYASHWGSFPTGVVNQIGWSVALTSGLFAVCALAALPRGWVFLACLVLVFVDGFRAARRSEVMWTAPRFERNGGTDLRALTQSLALDRGQRPARLPGRDNLDGYWAGAFASGDYSCGDQLKATQAIRADPGLGEFFMRPGHGLLVAEVKLPWSTPEGAPIAPSVFFSPTRSRYHVQTGQPAILVENEPSYPGWTAARLVDGAPAPLEPVPSVWPARAWRVPAGEYTVEMSYRTPGGRAGAALSALALLVWAALALRLLRRRPPAGEAAGAGSVASPSLT